MPIIKYARYVELKVVSTLTVAELDAVTVERKVNAPELGAAQLGATPEPPEVSTLPAEPEAPPTNNPVVIFGVVNTGVVKVLFVRVSVPVKVAKPEAVNAALVQAEPVHTNKLDDVVFQYKAPVSKAFPSLSTDGALDLEPKYRSSNAS